MGAFLTLNKHSPQRCGGEEHLADYMNGTRRSLRFTKQTQLVNQSQAYISRQRLQTSCQSRIRLWMNDSWLLGLSMPVVANVAASGEWPHKNQFRLVHRLERTCSNKNFQLLLLPLLIDVRDIPTRRHPLLITTTEFDEAASQWSWSCSALWWTRFCIKTTFINI